MSLTADTCPVCYQLRTTSGCGCPPGGQQASVPFPYYPQQPGFQVPTQQGWECPKCGRVYAPFMPACTHCVTPAINASDTNREVPGSNPTEGEE